MIDQTKNLSKKVKTHDARYLSKKQNKHTQKRKDGQKTKTTHLPLTTQGLRSFRVQFTYTAY